MARNAAQELKVMGILVIGVSGALSVALLVIRVFVAPNGSISVENVVDMGFIACVVLPAVLIGVQGLRFFKRSDIQAHFGGSR
jgi:hypothetical protein